MKYCSVCGGGSGPSRLLGREETKEERRIRKIREGNARRDAAMRFYKYKEAQEKKFYYNLPASIREQYLREASLRKSPKKKSPRKSSPKKSSPKKSYIGL